jgi:hypothetical protein
MSRRIVFAGSAQTRALARIYRGEISIHTGDDVVFIGTGAVGTDAARSTLLLADVLAMEVDEDGDAIPAAELPGQAKIVRIPNLYCDFLWPFAGRANPRNRGAFTLPGGPYPAEHGDRFLDQMVADGVDEDTAIARYLAMDIVTEGELDSRLADRLDILRKLDATDGYEFAGFIGDHFRTEPLFRTRQRVTMPLMRRLAAQVFDRIGVQGWSAGSLRRVPFPAGAQPIHPGIIAHFGLTWVAPEQEYPVNEEGFFNFEAFCRRYMRFAWNEVLHRGIQTAKTNPAAAIADLEAGLKESPESPLGQLALVVARRAAGLDPRPADPAIVIDEDSYDPELEGAPVDGAPVEGAEIEGAATEFASTRDATAEDAAAAAPAAHAVQDEAPAAEPEAALLEAAAPAAESIPPPLADTPFAEDPVLEDAARGDDIFWAEDDLIADAAPAIAPEAEHAKEAEPAAAEQQAPLITRIPAPPKPGNPAGRSAEAPRPGSIADGFTDFRPVVIETEQPALATPGSDLIEVLPRLLPVFADLASSVDRPFGSMPEVMPPPPLRPILPPELQDDAPRPGLFARMLGRR